VSHTLGGACRCARTETVRPLAPAPSAALRRSVHTVNRRASRGSRRPRTRSRNGRLRRLNPLVRALTRRLILLALRRAHQAATAFASAPRSFSCRYEDDCSDYAPPSGTALDKLESQRLTEALVPTSAAIQAARPRRLDRATSASDSRKSRPRCSGNRTRSRRPKRSSSRTWPTHYSDRGCSFSAYRHHTRFGFRHRTYSSVH